jgi:excisionase family DNA binding protein
MSTSLDAEFVTVEEAAALLRVDRSTIRRWISSGALPGYRVGQRFVRVKRDDLAQMIAPARGRVHRRGEGSLASGAPGGGMRSVSSTVQIRPLTPEEQEHALAALEHATRFRERMREKYGEFRPGSGELLREIRQERTEQLP